MNALRRIPWTAFGLGLVLLLALPFALRSLGFGLEGLTPGAAPETYLFTPDGRLANLAIFGHMVAGAAITVLAPLQILAAIRRRVPRLHRWSGYVLAAGAGIAGVGGLTYIALRGTIGGPLMDVGFAVYGLCLLVAAWRTVRAARARDFARHRAWALRLFVLAIGSWLYRVHYTLWYLATGGIAFAPDFTGLFDQVQVFAFYVPYLILIELWLRLGPVPEVAKAARV